MSLFVVVLLKKRFIIKKQKEKRKTRDEKTREVKMDIKRRLRPDSAPDPKNFAMTKKIYITVYTRLFCMQQW